ncbi:MAG TPA: CCA tRNA nucleotidyltransferase [Stellaceae bacterium]|nr:CCA tRNA nucleotidyltransferase [Stellaceae bacterium]
MTSGPSRRIPPPDWTRRPAVRRITDALGDGRFVGGAVRDTLLGRPIGDVDLATPLPPDMVIERLEKAGIKAVPTGIAHGTVTAVADGQTIEVTTLRRDVETDGRHAVVAYTDDWAEDAARRDFTMNALYLDPNGGIWDPAGGIEDCLEGRVRFVGDPAARIAEDRLRLLRFYRFQAHYGRTQADPQARAACRAAALHLAALSGERIRNELLKLLAAPDPLPTLRLMAEDGVLARLLPEPADLSRLEALVAQTPEVDPLLRLGALLPQDTAEAVADRLKLSNAERDRLASMAGPAIDLDADARAQQRLLYALGRERYRDRMHLEAAAARRPDRQAALAALADAWEETPLPVQGADVVALGVPTGPRVGELLRQVEAWWIAEDFRPARAAALDRLRDLVAESRAARLE